MLFITSACGQDLLRRCSFMKSHPGCFLQVSEWSLRLCLGGRALRHEMTRAGLESARSSLAKHFTRGECQMGMLGGKLCHISQ